MELIHDTGALANQNITSPYTLIDAFTPSETEPTLCQLVIQLGKVFDGLTGTGDYQLMIALGIIEVAPGPRYMHLQEMTVPTTGGIAFLFETVQFIVPADTPLSVYILSPNEGDTSVFVQGKLYDVGGIDPTTTALIAAIDAATQAIQAQTGLMEFNAQGRIKSAPLTGKTTVGGDGFMFTAEAVAATAKVLVEASVDYGEQYTDLDALVTIKTTQASKSGTQWQINTTAIQHDANWNGFAGDPEITFTSSDTNVATVDNHGAVSYVAAGEFSIICTSEATSTSPAFEIVIPLTNIENTDTEEIVEEIVEPAPLEADKHILICYNGNSADTTDLLSAMQTNLPGMYADGDWVVNMLELNCSDDSSATSSTRTTNEILNPIYAWLIANPDKPIRHIVLLRGVASRETDVGAGGTGTSIPWLIARLYYSHGDRLTRTSYSQTTNRFTVYENQGLTALVSVLDMGTKAQTIAYMEKIKSVADLGGTQSDGITVKESDSTSTLGGTHWYLDEKRSNMPGGDENYDNQYGEYETNLLEEGVSAEDITYQDDNLGTAITELEDVTFYGSWGKYNTTLGPDFPPVGTATMSGGSGWYLAQTHESFCGVMQYIVHSDPSDWYAINVFGGSNYEYTPVCHIGYTREPQVGGMNDYRYSLGWYLGLNAAECAWCSWKSNYFNHYGWPFVER